MAREFRLLEMMKMKMELLQGTGGHDEKSSMVCHRYHKQLFVLQFYSYFFWTYGGQIAKKGGQIGKFFIL